MLSSQLESLADHLGRTRLQPDGDQLAGIGQIHRIGEDELRRGSLLFARRVVQGRAQELLDRSAIIRAVHPSLRSLPTGRLSRKLSIRTRLSGSSSKMRAPGTGGPS